MKKPYPHIRIVIIQPSFPNNKLSSRPRKKKVVKRKTIDYNFTPQFRLPASAIHTPYDLPNPTDNAPSFSNYWLREENSHIMHESPFGELMPFGAGGLANAPQTGLNNIESQFYTEINLEVFDPSPLAVFVDVGNGYSWQAFPETGYYTDEDGLLSLTFVSGLDYPSMYEFGYLVNVTAYDETGNVAYMETEIDGIFSGLVDFLEMVWAGLCGVFSAVADAVARAMSFLVDIIMEIINGLIDLIVQPIMNMISNWVLEYNTIMYNLFNPLFPESTDSLNLFGSTIPEGIVTISTLLNFLLIPLSILTVAFAALEAIEAVAGVFTGGATTLSTAAISQILVTTVISSLLATSFVIGKSSLVIPSFDVLLSAFDDAGQVWAITVAALEAAAVFVQWAYNVAEIIDASALSIISYIILSLSTTFDNWAVNLIIDFGALVIGYAALKAAFFSAKGIAEGFYAPISAAFGKGMSLFAISSCFVTVFARYIDGVYDYTGW